LVAIGGACSYDKYQPQVATALIQTRKRAIKIARRSDARVAPSIAGRPRSLADFQPAANFPSPQTEESVIERRASKLLAPAMVRKVVRSRPA